MPRRKKRKETENPLFVGLSALIAVLLIISLVFEAPFIPVVTPSGETVSLGFSAIGLPLIAALLFLIVFVRVRK
jgi:polyferredoxin